MWSNKGSPTAHVASELGLPEHDVSDAIHAIKAANNLRGSDNVRIYDNGDVEDQHGEWLGNIRDEI